MKYFIWIEKSQGAVIEGENEHKLKQLAIITERIWWWGSSVIGNVHHDLSLQIRLIFHAFFPSCESDLPSFKGKPPYLKTNWSICPRSMTQPEASYRSIMLLWPVKHILLFHTTLSFPKGWQRRNRWNQKSKNGILVALLGQGQCYSLILLIYWR